MRKHLLAALALLTAVGAIYAIRAADSPASAGQAAPAAEAAPAGATRVQTVTIAVSDQAKARDFYVNKLGFTVVKDSPGVSERWLELAPPWGVGSTTIVLSTVSQMKAGSARGLFWEVNDCQSAVLAVRANGVDVQDCVDAPPGPLADFADPDGNVWTLADCDGGSVSGAALPEAVEPVNLTDGTLANVGIPVSDQDRALAFYVDTLGFTVVKDRPNPAPFPGRYIELAGPGGGAHLTLSVWWDTMPAGSRTGMTLSTGDVAATARALHARGVAVDDQTGAFADPDGNAWTLSRASNH